MTLETEFRLHLHRYRLEKAFARSLPEFAPQMWVRLLEPPTDFSADEALLLCQCSQTYWVAWVPDYGQITLSIEQFDRL